jgi:gliding motility-associated-like protein
MAKLILTLSILLTSIIGYSQCEGVITYTIDTPPGPGSTYPPGTTVQLCVTMTGWNGNAEGSNWNEGFGLNLGVGWDVVTPVSPPDDAESDASGTWLWMTNVTSDATGLTAGPGYFFEGPTGPIDGNPGNDWGDYCMNGDCIWTFCVDLTAQNGIPGLDLHIGVTQYADGTMGSWGTEMCTPTQDVIFDGSIGCFIPGCTDPLACNFDPTAGCDDGNCGYFSMTDITHNFVPCPDTTCIGSEVTYSVNGNQFSIYDWHITGGGLVTTDQTNDCEIIWGDAPGTYTVTVQEITPQGCVGEIKTCDVVVVVPDITFDTTEYRICLNSLIRLNAEPFGGSWVSDEMNGNTFIGTKPGIYYPSYVTNIYGCDISESVKVNVKQKYEAPPITYTTEFINLCTESGESYYSTPDSLNYTYSWFIENAKQPESSNQLFTQWPDTSRVYLIKVIGYDEIGCESEPSLMSIKVESCQRFFAPNSFTPNGDGTNDVFELRGMSVYQPTLKIFDRWGNVVYQSNNLWWTGDCGTGYYCNTDVYNWIIEYRDKDGFNKEEKGFVTLVR